MPARTRIEEIMSSGVFTVRIDDVVQKADEIMKNENVRHVPVLDGSQYVGLITERSLMEYTLRQLYEFDMSRKEVEQNRILDFQNIMTRQSHVIYPEDSVKKAVKLMAKYKYDCLPVVDWSNNLVGILTSIDIMLFIHNKLTDDEVLLT